MKFRRAELIMSWVGVLVVMVVPAAFGEAQDQLSKLHPYIWFQGEYNDNINLTQDNPIGDFITTVYPGLKYRSEGGGYQFLLDYRLGLNFYASESKNNYISQDGRLNTYYSFNPRWTFRLNDTITQSREGVQSYTVTTTTGGQSSNVTSTSHGSLYLRNIFEPDLEYKFGREDLVGLQYRNIIYRVYDGTGEDSTGNSIITRLAYWFNIRNGINLDYTFTTGQFEGQPDGVGNTVEGRYFYRFNPRNMVFGAYSFGMRDFQGSDFTDYTVHSTRVGVEYSFSPTLKGRAELGWFWQLKEKGDSFNKPVYSLSLTQQSQKTNYTVSLDGGYQEQYFTADNLGFTWFNHARAGVTHRVGERMSLGFTGTLGMEQYQNPDRIDWTWGLTGNFSYQPLKWLTISLLASTITRDSDLSGNNYLENRVSLNFKAEF
jgi:hypothetical protein